MHDLRSSSTRTTTARTAALAAAALGLLMATTGCGSDSPSTGGDTAVPVAQVGTATPTPRPTPATTPPPTIEPALADGRYEVQVLAAGGGSVELDLGRFVVGEPVEPGVDSTAPITFDTGASEQDADIPLAGDARLTLHVAGRGAAQVTAADLAGAVETSTGAFLATVEVAGGEVVSLEELYRA